MRRHLNIISVILGLAVVFSTVIPAAAGSSAKSNGGGGNVRQSSNGVYIVQMLNDPTVAYTGGIQGLNATKPGKGQKIDPNSSDVRKYVAYLDARHDEALNRAGGGQKLYDYHYSYNGFAAKLSLEQANRLTTLPGVLNVS